MDGQSKDKDDDEVDEQSDEDQVSDAANAGEEAGSNDDDNDDDLEDEEPEDQKRFKKGIIYFSHIPPGMDVRRMREIFTQFGEVGRIYLEKDTATKAKGKKAKFYRYIEGWLEFKKKRTAKKVAAMMNGQQVGGKRRSVYYDSIWSIKYLHRFKWHHLKEQIGHERALDDRRLRFEIDQARKETNFFLEMAEQRKRKRNPDNIMEQSLALRQKQRTTDEKIRQQKNDETGGVDIQLLEKIFG
ncbi:uncharacterized protein LOC141852519 [Brevipalpus obovatus]|uniref:uncharacterized protein LOC141852519 n=1 Tax=Brevipalpus obovatus TaxID=246614 RepID=UPI003D9F40C5